MLKQKYFLTGIFILSAERQPIKLAWRKIVWLQVDGVPVIGHEEKSSAIDQSQPVSPGRNDHPVRIWVEIRISNGLHLSQKNLSYPDLVRMVEKLEGLC